jgi:hypothetical protein
MCLWRAGAAAPKAGASRRARGAAAAAEDEGGDGMSEDERESEAPLDADDEDYDAGSADEYGGYTRRCDEWAQLGPLHCQHCKLE